MRVPRLNGRLAIHGDICPQSRTLLNPSAMTDLSNIVYQIVAIYSYGYEHMACLKPPPCLPACMLPTDQEALDRWNGCGGKRGDNFFGVSLTEENLQCRETVMNIKLQNYNIISTSVRTSENIRPPTSL